MEWKPANLPTSFSGAAWAVMWSCCSRGTGWLCHLAPVQPWLFLVPRVMRAIVVWVTPSSPPAAGLMFAHPLCALPPAGLWNRWWVTTGFGPVQQGGMACDEHKKRLPTARGWAGWFRRLFYCLSPGFNDPVSNEPFEVFWNALDL